MDMIVAAGGGERDYAADEAILAALREPPIPGALLNERLLADLRPTLFLAQLSNLLAGNISLVHGVVGSSRTFMGEEAAGTDAVRIACARIAAGQGELFLVGGSFNAERPDTLMIHEAGGVLWKHAHPASMTPGPFAPVWQRQAAGGGMVLGSVGCFLVIESRAHAAARGATPIARIAAVATDRCRRRPGEATAIAERQLAALRPALEQGAAAVISGASGAAGPTDGGGGVPAQAGPAGAGRRDGAGPLVGSRVPRQPGAGGDGGGARAGCSRRWKPAEAPMAGRVAPGAGHRPGACWRGEAMALVD